MGGTLEFQCVGFLLQWLFLLWNMGSKAFGLQKLRHVASVVTVPGLQSTGNTIVVHGLSCSLACGILLDQGQNPCLLYWQADSLPLNHRGSPRVCFDIN